MNSLNMNYLYNVEYFECIFEECLEASASNKQLKDKVTDLNKQIRDFVFQKADMFEELRTDERYCSFELDTAYPGLLIGTGNLHDIAQTGAYKLGFTFDYVNGLPYLPGSSLKGILRNAFPGQHEEDKEGYAGYMKAVLKEIMGREISDEELAEMENDIFEFQDVFLGAYPVVENDKLLANEFITPHGKSQIENPIPLSFVKVKSGVSFRFSFLLHDSEKSGLDAKQKKALFQRLILDFGVGAKTNVGFGKFVERSSK